MRRIASLLAAFALAGAAQAQIAPSPATPKPADTPVSPDSGIPSDVHTTPPPVTSQAPPPTPADTAPAETKAKGRSKPSSTAKQPPRS